MHSRSLPTPTELAHIAAELSKGGDADLHGLAERALRIWVACHQILREAATHKPATEPITSEPPIPQPESFPVSLDKFLLLALPQAKPMDRMRYFRMMREEGIQAMRAERKALRAGRPTPSHEEILKEPAATPEEVQSDMKYYRTKGISKESYEMMFWRVQSWLKDHKAKISSMNGRKGGKAKHSKNGKINHLR